MTIPTGSLLPQTDPARELALVLAVDFHKEADSDDPKTVVDTAEDFLAFLLAGVTSEAKHALASV